MTLYRLIFQILLFSLFSSLLPAQSIADARVQPLGSTITVRGIVTNGPELGRIRYLQDGTAGIAAFPGTGSAAGFDTTVKPGDSIEVSGTLISFNGLLEITPIVAYNIISVGNPLPAPKVISFSEFSEDLESQLVAVKCVSFVNAGGIFNSSGTWSIVDTEGEAAKTYLRTGHPLIGSSISSEPVLLQAILSDFNGFQLLPRYPSDMNPAACFYFTEKTTQSNISTTGFQVNWSTNLPADCSLRIGTSPNPNDLFPVAGTQTNHAFVFSNLNPGTIYWVQVEARHDGETIFSNPVPFATQSLSTGQIKTYFNKGIDPEFANGFVADGETPQAVLAETIARIDAAQQTLDVAIYNNNRSDLTNAVAAAHARGVRVRYVAALDASNPALNTPPVFPLLRGNTEALMHNKFMVIDADLSDKAWIMSGSLNWTNQNVNTDFNNTLFIQDQSLARAYELEFEEMWGSSGIQPDTLKSRFGSAKFDNTPHEFIVGGHRVELYFSPSDGTTKQLESVVRSAQSEALFAAFSFTKNELGDALIDVSKTTASVRGIMENINDNGSEYYHLLANEVNVRHHNLSGEFHHKYVVVDAYDLSSDPTVATGSHNWSNAAETTNDENTLILHDPAVAALFKAEFEKRWGEFPVSTQTAILPAFSVFPNPTTSMLEFRGLPAVEGMFLVKNALGQVLSTVNREQEADSRVDVSDLTPGTYFVTFISAHGVASVPFQKI